MLQMNIYTIHAIIYSPLVPSTVIIFMSLKKNSQKSVIYS